MKHLLLVLTTLFLVTACTKINNENYESIEIGMDYRDVETLLGNPSECDDLLGMKQCQWGSDSKYINVKFVASKVTIYSKKGL